MIQIARLRSQRNQVNMHAKQFLFHHFVFSFWSLHFSLLSLLENGEYVNWMKIDKQSYIIVRTYITYVKVRTFIWTSQESSWRVLEWNIKVRGWGLIGPLANISWRALYTRSVRKFFFIRLLINSRVDSVILFQFYLRIWQTAVFLGNKAGGKFDMENSH